MGLIRLLLAISVITAHSNPFFGLTFIQGQMAVEVFFMISGFYMALILSEKYTKKSDYKLFISNRFLKIFPIYWIILILSLITQLIFLFLNPNSPNIFALFSSKYNLNPISLIAFIITNLTIFGQDILLFFGLNPHTGSLFFTTNFRLFKPETFNFIFINQAWSLSLELTFYFLAPFLNGLKNKYLLLIISLSLAFRFLLYSQGLNHDPWNYRFFPTELIFFLFGILMYRIYNLIKNKSLKNISIISFVFYLFFLTSYQFLPHERTKQLVLFLFSFIFIPFIFNLFKNNKIDRYIGELSYPVYISHFLVIDTLINFTHLPHQLISTFTITFSVILSIILLQFIINPINKFRQLRLLKSNQKI